MAKMLEMKLPGGRDGIEGWVELFIALNLLDEILCAHD